MGLGKYKAAITAFNKAIKLNPNEPYAWFNKGDSYQKLGKYKGAIKSYNEAIKLDPNTVQFQCQKERAIEKSKQENG